MSITSEMKVWCDSVTAGAKGKVAGTYDALGTVTIKKNAAALLYIIANIATPKPTAGISGTPVLQINSADLGISEQKVVIGNSTIGDGISTNNKELYVLSQIIPWKLRDTTDIEIGNGKVTFSLSSSTAVTEGWDASIGLVVANQEPDVNFAMELLARQHSRAIGGNPAFFSAGIKAAAETAFTEVITVNSTASELIALQSLLGSNAPTANEGITGYTKFTASQIDDFSPQLWPFIVGQHGSIGTPVGTPSGAFSAPYYPTRFPLPKTNFDIAVAQKCSVALTNEGDGNAGALWR